MKETIHGNNKRIEFMKDVIHRESPQSVLDIGCGNGVYLTIPLAEYFSSIQFTGIDSDKQTIELATNEHSCSNLTFTTNDQLGSDRKFDLIIASEVIEHVEDPAAFLAWVHSLTSERAKVVITTPNGYGPFELTTVLETLFDLSGVMKVLSRIPLLRKLKVGDSYTSNDVRSMQHDTLAISPHVNFFGYSTLTALFRDGGYDILEYRARAFLGGLGFNQLMRSQRVLEWNSRISDSLSPRFVSGWMFVLRPNGNDAAGLEKSNYKRRLNEKIRRHLTAKRWAR